MSPRRWFSAGKVVLKGAIAVVVVAAVGRHVQSTWTQFRSQGRSLQIDPAWFAASIALYLCGLCCFGMYFGRLMRNSPSPIGYAASVRAYLVSHLGKYVPGKAIVVVMRAGMVSPYGARTATAAFATLYETLVMMATGGLVAAVGFSLGSNLWLPVAASLGLGTAFLVLVEPRVFPRLSAVISVPFPGVGPDSLPRFSHRLLAEGMLWSCAGWLLLGLSQIGVIFAIAPSGFGIGVWPVVIASVALATVAGFAVAVLPGGLGVREWVLMIALAPALGRETADLSALALRLSWVIGEVLVAALLLVIRPPLPANPSSPLEVES